MELLKKITDNIINIDVNTILSKIYERKEFQDIVIDLNINEQLFKLGIDSSGKSLGVYSPKTIEIKIKKGQPTDRVTLKDTGDFYKTFKIKVEEDGFVIDADSDKDDANLEEVYGENIIGLTDENLRFLIEIIKDEVVRVFNEQIQAGL